MDDGLRAFAALKALILEQYCQAYPHFQGKLTDFRQTDIANLQDLLEQRLQDRISEKWFYTHLKVPQNEKLPRIDMLDLLARFVGFESWEAFRFRYEKQRGNSRRKWTLLASLATLLLVSAAFTYWPTTQETFELCFYDVLRQEAIDRVAVQVSVESGGRLVQQANTKTGEHCLQLQGIEANAKLICSAPYYHPDTIAVAEINSAEIIDIHLQVDDYALMIHYFSTSKIEDWKRRREQLRGIFAEDAIIYQVDPEGLYGMDILNKSEFINRMTIPSKSLRGVEVLQTSYRDGKIVELRFTVNAS
ncbi:MAG: hypothetical protein AAFP77_05625 [Bacteroidota bacterium]